MRRASRKAVLCAAAIVPGGYVCGYEDLEDIGLELGEVCEPLFLHYTKATVRQVREEKNPDILNVHSLNG